MLAGLPLLLACGDGTGTEPWFPADHATRYTAVRTCVRSADHDLAFVQIFAAPDAVASYLERQMPFPVGAVLVKQEYADPGCSDLVGYTAMRKERAEGGVQAWGWQRVSPAGAVEFIERERCASCHESCVTPLGHDHTCAE